jgi:hypothetical protein
MPLTKQPLIKQPLIKQPFIKPIIDWSTADNKIMLQIKNNWESVQLQPPFNKSITYHKSINLTS